MRNGIIEDATMATMQPSVKNEAQARHALDEQQANKSSHCHVGIKADVGPDASGDLVHALIGAWANDVDVTQSGPPPCANEERPPFLDAGYVPGENRSEPTDRGTNWQGAMHHGQVTIVSEDGLVGEFLQHAKSVWPSIRSKVENPFEILGTLFYIRKVPNIGSVRTQGASVGGGALPGVSSSSSGSSCRLTENLRSNERRTADNRQNRQPIRPNSVKYAIRAFELSGNTEGTID